MNVATSSLFSRLLSLVDRNRFAKLVRETGSERRSKGFASWDHFVAMLSCQLAQAKSLREMVADLFEKLFCQVLGNVSLHAPGKKFRFKSKLYCLDSTVIVSRVRPPDSHVRGHVLGFSYF
jgi:hypothetical protein